ncbi:MAG: hypothetical protein A3J10_00930 [Candidatus Sungbacteria bacterium RIFCSPLOWO2_02_FULL_54_10]|nr:MAG: hypothetical protein A3J10_00930 [Candidatus Sungbacteria bacterium RIFCSPLOWO2_02_FULL_54_10]
MNHKTYMQASTAIFAVIALGHLARVIFGWDAAIGGWLVPMWISWAAILVGGFLAYTGYKQQH